MEECASPVTRDDPSIGGESVGPEASEPAPELELLVGESAAVEVAEPFPYITVIRLTRAWVQLGIFGFAVFCIIVGAVEAMFGR